MLLAPRLEIGVVVGLVTAVDRRNFTGEVDAYVGELVVDVDHERRGVGTLLLNAVEDWARRRGLRHEKEGQWGGTS